METEEGYRRGAVLGLTIAEIFILLVFLMLLALMGVNRYWGKKFDSWKEIMAKATPEEVEVALKHSDERGRDIERLKKEVEALEKEKARLQERIRVLEDTEREKALADAERKIETLNEKIGSLEKEIRIFGKGITPPCWYQRIEETNPITKANWREKPYYLFDIAIREDHMEVQRLPIPEGSPEDDSGAPYAEKADSLALDTIPYGTPLTDTEMRNVMLPLYEMGKASQVRTYSCIFYVRVWDETPPGAKERWKQAHDGVLEQLFGTHQVRGISWKDRGKEPVNVKIMGPVEDPDVYLRPNPGQSSVCADNHGTGPLPGIDMTLAESADYWGYDPEKAYGFGLAIQDAVRKKDLLAFFSLVDGELEHGPRRKHAENKDFREIFPDSWGAKVLKDEPPCTPVGLRGFMLANGLIWYKGSDTFRIVSVNDWVQEELPPISAGWEVDGRLLPPQCFVVEGLSSDNFEEFAKRFSIADTYGSPEFEDFAHNTGKYFGDPISPFDPIDFYGQKISLWGNVIDCAGDSDQLRIEDLTVRDVSEEYQGAYDEYTILSDVSTNLCQELAPNLPGECLKSYLVEFCGNGGGSIGCIWRYNIYGLFRMEDGEKIIFPMKNFDAENLARNFLDSASVIGQ